MNLKTSTWISLKFILFNIFSLFFMALAINIFYFWFWTNKEKQESIEDIETYYHKAWNSFNDEFIKLVLEKWGYIKKHNWEFYISSWINYNSIINNKFWFFVKDNNSIFIVVNKNYNEWVAYIVYDISNYFYSQIALIYISIIVILLFLLVSYFISIFFTKSSLKNLNKIVDFVKDLNIDNLSWQINIDGPNNDEIKIVWDKLNQTIKKLNFQTDKLKQFTSDVSHEFKTPLMVINSQIDLAIKSWDYINWLINIKNNIKWLDELVDTLLFISRIDDNIIHVYKTSENIWKIVKEIFDNIKISYEFKNIQIINEIDESVYLDTDKKSFSIIISNLISNAFKYTNNHWTISLYLDTDKFLIKDNWIWINSENIDKIWSRFWKEDLSRTSNWFWLWLYTVKKLSDMLWFEIMVFSKKWFGTEFIIKFK